MAQIIKFENDKATGLATPRYGAQRVAQNLDPDLFIRMLQNHPEHIERSKQKGQRIREEARQRVLAEQEEMDRKDQQMIVLGFLSGISSLVAAVAVSLLL